MSESELKKVAQEVTRPGYYQRAQQRAQRRKGPWNLLLIPLVLGGWGVICYSLVHAVLLLSSLVSSKPSVFSDRSEGVKTLLVMPILFAALPLAMIAANFLLHLLPPARRALDREADGHPGTDFVTSQRQLWAIGGIVFVIGFTISFLVAVFVR